MATEKKPQWEAIRKISVKTVYGEIDLEALLKDKAKTHHVMDVFGVARRTKPGESDNGPFMAFMGEFRAIAAPGAPNGAGAMYRAPKVFLPKFLEEEVAATIGDGETVKSVEFGYRIYAKYDKDAATKYVYMADSLLEPEVSDAMLALESRMADATKQLTKK